MKRMFDVLLGPSITRRLIAALLLACALVWVGIYAQGLYMVRASGSGNFDTEMLRWAETVVRVVDANHANAGMTQALASLDVVIQVAVDAGDIPVGFQAFQVHASDGQLLGRGGHGPEVLSSAQAEGYFDAGANAERFRVYRRWSSDRRHRIDVTQSHRSRQQIFDKVMISREGLLHPLLVGFPLLLVPVLIAVYTGLAPLRRLSRELASRGPADLAPLKVQHVYRELAPVVGELNATMTRLQELLQRERDFLADAAHELRTPLALISAQCETLLQSHSPASREDAAKRMHAGMTRASRLVNQLLSLARLEADVEHQVAATDLADLVRDCLAAHATQARARDIELSYLGPDSLVSQCPGQAVHSILDNLVGNAIRYGHSGGQLEVRLVQHPQGTLQLSVLDDGPGIAVEDRHQLFERFRRGSNPTASGSGLGLAIVASAARQLAAQIEVSTGLAGQGAGFTVSWPHCSRTILQRHA